MKNYFLFQSIKQPPDDEPKAIFTSENEENENPSPRTHASKTGKPATSCDSDVSTSKDPLAYDTEDSQDEDDELPQNNSVQEQVTGTEGYKCYVCNYKFDKRNKFNKHVFQYGTEGNFACDECELRFVIERNLETHKRTTHGDQRKIDKRLNFNCKYCNQLFRCKDVAYFHMAHLHNAQFLKDKEEESSTPKKPPKPELVPFIRKRPKQKKLTDYLIRTPKPCPKSEKSKNLMSGPSQRTAKDNGEEESESGRKNNYISTKVRELSEKEIKCLQESFGCRPCFLKLVRVEDEMKAKEDIHVIEEDGNESEAEPSNTESYWIEQESPDEHSEDEAANIFEDEAANHVENEAANHFEDEAANHFENEAANHFEDEAANRFEDEATNHFEKKIDDIDEAANCFNEKVHGFDQEGNHISEKVDHFDEESDYFNEKAHCSNEVANYSDDETTVSCYQPEYDIICKPLKIVLTRLEDSILPPGLNLPDQLLCSDPVVMDLVCKTCKITFPSYEKYERHRKSLHVAYVSSICRARYTSQSKLAVHYIDHIPRQNFTCCVCGEVQITYNALYHHVKIHCIEIDLTIEPLDLSIDCKLNRRTNTCLCGEQSENFETFQAHTKGCEQWMKAHYVAFDYTYISNDNENCAAMVEVKKEVVDTEETNTDPAHHTMLSGRTVSPKKEKIDTLDGPNKTLPMVSIMLDPSGKIPSNPPKSGTVYPCQVCGTNFQNEANLRKHDNVYKNKFSELCPYCDVMFPSKVLLRHHVASAHDPNNDKEFMHRCTICNQGFSRNMSLKHHMAHIHGKKSGGTSSTSSAETDEYRCIVCSMEFETLQELVFHRRYYNEHQSYYCQPCEVTFKGEFRLQMHNKLLHSSPEAREKYQHPCTICGECFENDNATNSHMFHVHIKPRANSTVFSFVQQDSLLSDMWMDPDLTCNVCGLVFNSTKEVSTHKDELSNDGSLQCHMCYKKCRNHVLLQRHQNLTHYNPNINPDLQCQTCKEVLIDQATLKSHVLHFHVYQSVDTPIQEDRGDHQYSRRPWETSGKIFKNTPKQTSNNIPELILTDNAPKQVLNKNDPQQVVVDNTLKPISTDSSSKEISTTPAQKEKGLVSNAPKTPPMPVDATLEKPQKTAFRCHVCGLIFKSKSAVADHMIEYENAGNLMCTTCKRQFVMLSHLKNHETQHDPEYELIYTHKCAFCPEMFSSKETLRVHMAHFHKTTISKPKSVKKDEEFQILFDDHSKMFVSVKIGNLINRNEQVISKEQLGQMVSSFFTDFGAEYVTSTSSDHQWMCQVCRLVFPGENCLNKHLHRYFQEVPEMYHCKFCDKKFHFISMLEDHLRKHFHITTNNVFTCPVCHERYLTNISLYAHKVHYHHDHGQKALLPQQNLQELPKDDIAEVNQSSSKNENEDCIIEEEKVAEMKSRFKCKICVDKPSFEKKEDFFHHVGLMHSNSLNENTNSANIKSKEEFSMRKFFICSCQKVFPSSKALKQHEETCNRLKCLHCLKYFNSEMSLKLHVENVHGNAASVPPLAPIVRKTAAVDKLETSGAVSEPKVSKSTEEPSTSNGSSMVGRLKVKSFATILEQLAEEAEPTKPKLPVQSLEPIVRKTHWTHVQPNPDDSSKDLKKISNGNQLIILQKTYLSKPTETMMKINSRKRVIVPTNVIPIKRLIIEEPKVQKINAPKLTFECKICRTRFVDNFFLMQHFKKKCWNNRCFICGILFITNEAMHKHILLHPDIHCQVCDAVFLDSQAFIHHVPGCVEQVKSDCSNIQLVTNQAGTSGVGGNKTATTSTVAVKCEKCHEMFANLSELSKHMKKVHLDYKCGLCATKFYTKSMLHLHMQRNHNLSTQMAIHVCTACKVGFIEKTDFDGHICLV